MNYWYSVRRPISNGQIENDRSPSDAARLTLSRPHHLLALLMILATSLISTGCYSWSPAAQIRQCQMESDRLLAEFRAQKKRADEMEVKYQQSQKQLAQTEKMLARQQNGFSGSSGILAERSGAPAVSSGRSGSTGKSVGNPALPSQSRSANLPSSEDSDPNIKWRPQGTPLR